MDFYLLDGVAAGFFVLAFGVGLAFITFVILVEAWIMKKMEFHESFKKASQNSLVANLLSMAGGFIVLRFLRNGNPDMNNLWEFLAYLGVTLLVEISYLRLANRSKSPGHTLRVGIVMNVVTYVIALILIKLFFT